jgi:hypothetical protein
MPHSSIETISLRGRKEVIFICHIEQSGEENILTDMTYTDAPSASGFVTHFFYTENVLIESNKA